MHPRHFGSIRFLIRIAGAGILAFSHNGRADGPPPSPPPPPPATAGPTSGGGGQVMPDDAIISEMEVTPTVLTLAGTDSVFVEAVVATRGFAVMAEMGGPRPWLRYALAAGDSLILDANTPAGVYDLADGRQILLGPPGGYPRSYGIRERAHPMLIFSVAS